MTNNVKISLASFIILSSILVLLISFGLLRGTSKIGNIENGVVGEGVMKQIGDIPDGTLYRDFEAISQRTMPLSGEIPDENLRDIIKQAVAEVNNIRISYGLKPLAYNSNLEDCAAVRAYECCQLFSHTRPNGLAWYTVDSNLMWGENLAYGYNNSDSVVTAWMNSPTHRDNILYADFNTIGISIYVQNGVYYWAQEFGH